MATARSMGAVTYRSTWRGDPSGQTAMTLTSGSSTFGTHSTGTFVAAHIPAMRMVADHERTATGRLMIEFSTSRRARQLCESNGSGARLFESSESAQKPSHLDAPYGLTPGRRLDPRR